VTTGMMTHMVDAGVWEGHVPYNCLREQGRHGGH